MNLDPLYAAFVDPPREFGVIPFWFWNDDLDDAEVLRQIGEFHANGFGGFLPHPRIGLARRVGYLTDEFFRLIRLAVAEAARLGLRVVLYDEGSYPSGSAQGRVVAENPAYAARCLIMVQQTIHGPARGYWRPNPGRALGDELIGVVAGREIAPGVIDPRSLTRLEVLPPELARYELGEGTWRLAAIWNVASGGVIRGVFDDEEDRHASAPPAGDLLNPDAVACFLRLTHDQYYAHLQEYFGTTVVAMFTDEPMLLGRDARRGPDPWPFTGGFLAEVQSCWDGDALLWTPALWLDYGERTAEFRQVYTRAVYERLERVFYGGQSRWCRDHGIALTGHPAESNDLRALRQFQWPGQDMVWRWVVPGADAALNGPHSCAPKTASSMAALHGSRRNASEALGAYGWRLTLDEAKWLLDWHLARGTNLFFLHACFYSLRGRRAFESEPDIGIHNSWWPAFRILGDYLRRMCWLLSDGQEVCEVAILTDADGAAWTAARELYRGQIDFIYIDDAALQRATIVDGRLALGAQRFRAVVCDPPMPAGHPVLAALRAAGGLTLTEWRPDTLVATLAAALGRDLEWQGAPELRALHYRKGGREWYLLFNEGETALEGQLSLATTGALELWDPLDGGRRPWRGAVVDGRTHTYARLERRQSLILAVDPHGVADPAAPVPPRPGAVLSDIPGPWQVFDPAGDPLDLACPGDWARQPAWETFTGRVRCQTMFTIAPEWVGRTLFLDLGQVGDIAEVVLNGVALGGRAWAPYIWPLEAACRAGENQLEVWIINSMANRLEGLQLPSGLIGPVCIRGED